MKKSLILIFCPIYFIFADVSSIDLKLNLDPFNPKHKSCLEFSSQNPIETENVTFLVTPSISYYFNHMVDFGISFGHRYFVNNFYLGHHIFFDRCQLGSFNLNQIGTGLDFISKNIDVKLNYYHPLEAILSYRDKFLKPCKWFEGEFTFKMFPIHLGFNVYHNLENSNTGFITKVDIPFEMFTFSLGSGYDQKVGPTFSIGTSLSLYNNKPKKLSQKSYSHSHRIRLLQKKPEEKKWKEISKSVTHDDEGEEFLNHIEDMQQRKKIYDEIARHLIEISEDGSQEGKMWHQSFKEALKNNTKFRYRLGDNEEEIYGIGNSKDNKKY